MKVSELLTKESKWCRHDFATNSEGAGCNVASPEATKFCLLGALVKCYAVPEVLPSVLAEANAFTVAKNKVHKAIAKLFGDKYDEHIISTFNDSYATDFVDIHNVIVEAGV